ncbi:hypothetical protein BJV78DRAFT_1157357 [Lactifluus subvellereus]|nr:hypothetical protein BJV78DRAFT_1157357 [Lactifluus subvellereus]
MSLPFSNATYRIRSIGSSSGSQYLTLKSTTIGTVIVVAAAITSQSTQSCSDDPTMQQWILRDQGYGGDGIQMVTLQSAYLNDLGFFAADKQTSGLEVKYSQLAWTVKLEDISDDNVTIRYTKGGKNLVLSVNNNDSSAELANRDTSDAKQQWSFEVVA